MSEDCSPLTGKLGLALLSFGGVVFAFLGTLILTHLSSEPEYRLEESLGVFIVVGLLSSPLLLWHLFDLFDRSPQTSKIVRKAASYHVMVSLALGALVLLIAMIFGAGHYNSCDQLDGALFHSCRYGISLWILLPFAAAIGVGWLLSAGKALVSISARLRKPT